MNPRVRLGVFLVAALGFVALGVWGVTELPPVGHYRGPYGDLLNARAPIERHVTDIVSAVNFDYRGFDTLGEEFILFASVMGAALLLRQLRDEREAAPRDEARDRRVPDTSDALRACALGLTAPTVLFGLDIVVHGHLTPGGGFQGGVVLATAPLLVYLAGDFDTFHHITPRPLIEIAEGCGCGGFALLGLLTALAGGAFLQNVLPLGRLGHVLSGGTIPVISVLTGLAVAAGFVLLLDVYLEEALVLRQAGER